MGGFWIFANFSWEKKNGIRYLRTPTEIIFLQSGLYYKEYNPVKYCKKSCKY